MKFILKKIKNSSMEVLWLEDIGRIKFYEFRGDKQVSDYIELVSIEINPNWMRKGYGTKLIRELEKITISRGIGMIRIRANSENKLFGKFLTKNGYVVPMPVYIFTCKTFFKKNE